MAEANGPILAVSEASPELPDISDQQELDAPVPAPVTVPPARPLLPYRAPKAMDPDIKPLRPSIGAVGLPVAPGMTEPEYNFVVSNTYVSNGAAPQEWEIAQGYERAYQQMYGMTY